MDPTTTLFTFMLQTHPSVQSVHLVGSWDNFSKTYAMERDARRDRGQWRGCHSFRDIICDGDSTLCMRRNGGLKQGETYYYYYELDGATETHDPSLPSTTACPFLPGQKVNTLSVPREQCLRKRSASMNSMRTRDFKTMNPEDKFVTPRAPPPVPGSSVVRAGTSPNPVRYDHHASRSESPIQSWPWSPRRLFTRKSSSRSLDKDQLLSGGDGDEDDILARYGTPSLDDDWRNARSDGSRSRDISPESLRRFLVDDGPLASEESAADHDRPSVLIPEDIAEEMEDDDNFASPASTESMLLTGLSPPPKRATSSSTVLVVLESPAESPVEIPAFPAPPTRPPPQLPMLQPPELDFPQSHFSVSSASSVASPLSPRSPDASDLPSFYHSESEEDDLHSSQDEPLPSVGADADALGRTLAAAFAGYRLPGTAVDAAGSKLALDTTAMPSPALFGGHDDADVPVGTTSLLSSPASGLDDLVSELGWMADVIRGKGGAS